MRTDDDILRAALSSFADRGYDGMSLRTLNAEMGLSRGTINQRFRSKQQLWYAAVDLGFRDLIRDLECELRPSALDGGDLGRFREYIRAFLIASSRHPELVRLMNQEGLRASPRLDHVMSTFTFPAMAATLKALKGLVAARRARDVSARTLLFLVAHGAAAPFTLGALSDMFDPVDGPLDPMAHVEVVTDIIVGGICPRGDDNDQC
ncbi:TetR/AcrR family transcriptional regulator [Mycobacterium marseillense]|uniref:TetR/AcrR family transcriptional regulator n=1 Tax=Mycobacterium marseillense TaxID=701042 RepID=UPI0015D2C8EA|nr:TetR/AcrR family transcriptional regulator [Mycobacterium marseillense]